MLHLRRLASHRVAHRSTLRYPAYSSTSGALQHPAPAPPAKDDGTDFNDAQNAYAGISSFALGRAWIVLKICTFPALVDNAETLLAGTRRVFGDGLVQTMVRPTFFNHFCAGTTEKDIRPTVEYLRKNGVGAILDYAAEADVDEAPPPPLQNDAPPAGATTPAPTPTHDDGGHRSERHERAWQSSRGQRKQTTARIYDYSTEQACDMNADIFASAIRAVHNVSPEGFAAIKVTALGNPLLLERWSSSIVEIRRLFRRLDTDGDNRMTRDEFEASWKEMFVDTAKSNQYLDELFRRLDVTRDGSIDLIEWTSSLKAADTFFIARHCQDNGPFAQASLDESEVELVDKLLDRAVRLVNLAEELDVRVMFDAEHSYFQPAIHNIVLELQRKFNRGKEARVYNTFQCYPRDSDCELSQHIERSEREGWHFACKLVRGAYMVLERDRADEQGYESPIHDTIENTHACYNGAMRMVLGRDAVREGRSKANMLVASHNQGSIELALKLMSESGISRSTGGVYFGQLLGMADHLTFSLGNSGYLAYKYLPYGPFYEVLPYLVRRAQENSSLLGNVEEERRMIKNELVRRIVPFMS